MDWTIKQYLDIVHAHQNKIYELYKIAQEKKEKPSKEYWDTYRKVVQLYKHAYSVFLDAN